MSLPAALAPFRVRSFRFQWPADLATSWAFEMEQLILGWYVLVETGSVMLLTLYWSLLYIGTLIAPVFGMVGDRVGQRAVLFGTRSVYLMLAVIIGTMAYSGTLSPITVFLTSTVAGLVRPSDIGVRSALVAATVPAGDLISAMSISRMTADSARVMGALVGAGLFVAFGMGPAYIAIACLYALSIVMLTGTGPEQAAERDPGETARPSPWRDLTAGMAYVWNSPRLNAAMWIALLVNFAAFPLITGVMPYVAKSVYGTDQTGLGYLVASLASGALIGSVALSIAGDRMRVERVMIASMIAWYTMLIVFGQVHTMSLGIPCLLLTGITQSVSMVTLAVVLLRNAAPRYRGRVMGVRMLAIYGNPVGLLLGGALVERIGYSASTLLYGGIGIVVTAVMVLRWRTAVLPREAAA
jgi:predicted MFS family arabinose efflux permease